jgi:hypothetical protein
VVVKDSTDGTRESIEKTKDNRIKIIDPIWDEEMRKKGKIFSQQSNIGLRGISGQWGFHLQADEVLHESAKELVFKYIAKADKYNEIDGLLFPYYNLGGDYSHIRTSRSAHRFEIRLFKNNRNVYSYMES